MSSAPGCWARYGDLVARGIGWGSDRGTVQLGTDAYAAQHATNPDARNRQSVAVHLMSLGATFGLGLPPGRTTALIGGWTHRVEGYPNLISNTIHGDLTIVQALDADGTSASAHAIERWARSVWKGWADHHATILELLAEYGLS
jgi:hypothetical protein